MRAITHHLLKLPVVLVGGLLATFALFFAMQALIQQEYELPGPGDDFGVPDITIPDPPLIINKETPKPQKPDEIVDPPVRPPNTGIDRPTGPALPQFKETVIDPPNGSDSLTIADSNALAIVQIAPVYPTRALTNGIEGYVVIEFDLDENGQVINPRVLYGEPPGVFDRAAVNALQRWRYNPKVVNGKPVRMYGLRQQLTFEIE